jgi:maltose/maltodextrin transport system permease protein
MSMATMLKSLTPKLMAVVLAMLALYGVVAVYASGQSLLAALLLLLLAGALWIYTSTRSMALRYLFPGLAAALVFVIFPMVFTVATGFTNYSSRNLLDEDGARAYLLDDRYEVPGITCGFSLHGEVSRWQIRLACPQEGAAPSVLWSPQLPAQSSTTVPMAAGADAAPAMPLPELVTLLPELRPLALQLPDGSQLRLKSLREFAPLRPLFVAQPDGSLVNQINQQRLRPNASSGFFETEAGERVAPGFRINVGWRNYLRIFTEPQFSEPFARIFVWTVSFAALTVILTGSLGMLLAVLLGWEALRGRAAYRLVLFLPYAVPGFISILVFKGLFNQNLGEVNLVLHQLFGLRPAWFSDPLLAKAMLLIVNTWLGFPYMMVLCSGLIKAIPSDLYEAAAVQGAGPLANFWHITLPLVAKPLTPLLIAAFAFNFNNFVLISLLTEGRPDFLDSAVPGGTTDLLVSYTWRIAFEDTGQQFGLAAALSTVIFLLVAAVTLVQMRFTRIAEDAARR